MTRVIVDDRDWATRGLGLGSDGCQVSICHVASNATQGANHGIVGLENAIAEQDHTLLASGKAVALIEQKALAVVEEHDVG